MPINRESWPEVFAASNFSSFPCPRCGNGRIARVENGIFYREAQYSIDLRDGEHFEPEWATKRFMAMLQCDQLNCGEVFMMHGSIDFVEEFEEQYGWYMAEVLRPAHVHPALHVFRISDEVPDSVKGPLVESFSLFWADLSACVAKMRVSLECALDELGVSRKRKTDKGKIVDLKLHDRIVAYQEKDKEIGDSFMAIKMVGNLGSHEVHVQNRDTIFDVYDLYEDALSEVFGKRSKKMTKLKAELIATRGRGRRRKKSGKRDS